MSSKSCLDCKTYEEQISSLEVKVMEKGAEVSRWKAANKAFDYKCGQLEAKVREHICPCDGSCVAKLLSKDQAIEKAVEALSFYASLWSHATERSIYTPEGMSDVEKDCGEKARKALELLKAVKNG